MAGTTASANNIEVTNSDYVIIKNLTSNWAIRNGVFIEAASTYCTVDNVIAHDNGDTVIDTEGGGVLVYDPGTDHITISNCIAYNNAGGGLTFHGEEADTFDGPDSCTITASKSYDNGRRGLGLSEVTNCVVEYSEAYGNGTNIVTPEQRIGIMISSDDGETSRGSGNIARYNYVHDQDGFGIEAIYEDDFILHNNLVDSCYRGIQIYSFKGGLVYNNTIYYSDYQGIMIAVYVEGSLTLKNNIIHESYQLDTDDFGIHFYTDVNGHVVSDHNTVSDTYFGRVQPAAAVNLADWRTATSQDANSLNSDPLFTDAANDDFTLKRTSPCIDAGVDLGATYDDALDPISSWPDSVATLDQDDYGSDWEIGAYGYIPDEVQGVSFSGVGGNL